MEKSHLIVHFTFLIRKELFFFIEVANLKAKYERCDIIKLAFL